MRRTWERTMPDDAVATYRCLRLAMPVLATMLAASIVLQVFEPTPNCLLDSISAYYYTSARAVFVACLCAIGTCLVVYRGSTIREDVTLNVSGCLAFVVALIPTPLEGASGALAACGRNVPTAIQLDAALHNNLVALLVGATAMALAYVGTRLLLPDGRGLGRPSRRAVVGTSTVVALAWVVYEAWPEAVEDHGHGVAAILLFTGIAAMVLMSAYPSLAGAGRAESPARSGSEPAGRDGYARTYAAIFWLMVLSLAGFGTARISGHLDTGVFWIETSLIVLFAVFWCVQTAENWDARDAPG